MSETPKTTETLSCDSTDTVITPFLSGFLSQWYHSPFTIDNIKYDTAEHYMMAEKARLFGDSETLSLILKSSTAKEAKALGRKVKNFDDKIWRKHARDIVYKGNLAKFQQNPLMKSKLLATKDNILVEGNPYDPIWAVKLRDTDAKILNPLEWKGTNWLGQVLMGVRVALGGQAPKLGKYQNMESASAYIPSDSKS
jgi:ribA/ribD-fused uncharacterized protein